MPPEKWSPPPSAPRDRAGYLEVLAQVLRRKGVLLAVYTDRPSVTAP